MIGGSNLRLGLFVFGSCTFIGSCWYLVCILDVGIERDGSNVIGCVGFSYTYWLFNLILLLLFYVFGDSDWYGTSCTCCCCCYALGGVYVFLFSLYVATCLWWWIVVELVSSLVVMLGPLAIVSVAGGWWCTRRSSNIEHWRRSRSLWKWFYEPGFLTFRLFI